MPGIVFHASSVLVKHSQQQLLTVSGLLTPIFLEQRPSDRNRDWSAVLPHCHALLPLPTPRRLLAAFPPVPQPLYQVALGQEHRNHTAVSQERLHGKGKEKTGIMEFQMAGSSGLLQGCGQSRGWDCGGDFQRWHLSVSARSLRLCLSLGGPHHFQGCEGTVLSAKVAESLILGPALAAGTEGCCRVRTQAERRGQDKTPTRRQERTGSRALPVPHCVPQVPCGCGLQNPNPAVAQALAWEGQRPQGTLTDFCPWDPNTQGNYRPLGSSRRLENFFNKVPLIVVVPIVHWPSSNFS